MLIAMFRTILGGGSYSPGDALMQVAAVVFVIFMTMPVHEAAHAWMAKKLGDDTGFMHGRLTLDPLKHIDWLGALMMLLVGFGYAKPVPVNPRNFKKPQRDMALTALAGPVSNLIMATVFLFAANAADFAIWRSAIAAQQAPSDALLLIVRFFFTAASFNITLAVFNLLPIPPLDGSRILTAFLPRRISYYFVQYETYIRYALFALLLLGVLNVPLGFLTGLVGGGLNFIASLPFRFL